ncbi:transcription factor ORG2-like [Juglans microcarpa x Juglans regia]|uniref:transcription factor ORG2-like n=1 Tax=Juglans microcarpa x Juglans regia TaxID=2249226 RepID=UPI001B7E47D9|nr:transcription factor ORG2-like [Juglans microcarpa x Juglans regia]
MINMFALSPTWPPSACIELESEQYSINQDQYCAGQSYGIHEDPQTFESARHLIPSSSYHKQVGLDPHAHVTAPTAPVGGGRGDPKMVQKLNHNASERERRKKMNGLYSSLRSLLPEADQMKKLSIPTTVSRMIKYIPELEQQVVGLIQRKEELLSRISRLVDQNTHQENQPFGSVAAWSSLSTVSASRVNDREIVIQIPTCEDQKTPLSEILLALEEDGLLLLNASSFEVFGGRAFYNLHLHEVCFVHIASFNCFSILKLILYKITLKFSIVPLPSPHVEGIKEQKENFKRNEFEHSKISN